MATTETQTVHPGDIIQSTAPDWTHALLFMVTGTHRWGVGASLRWRDGSRDGEDFETYARFKPGTFSVIGAAVLMPPEVMQARRDSIATARAVAKESGK